MDFILEKILKGQITREELEAISYIDVLKLMLRYLRPSSRIEDISKADLLEEILLQLRAKDEIIHKMGKSDVQELLQLISIYKLICNLNESENRVANSLEVLKNGIYDDSLHFFLELIQNADDASAGSLERELKISIKNDETIVFEYDERGFNFSDVFAITSIGNSTKIDKKIDKDGGSIGEKGIGFKSIFAVVEKVSIDSKFFSFDIVDEKDNPSSILELRNIGESSSEKTVLTLHLKKDFKTGENFEKINDWMKENIEKMDLDNPFLFLKNIRKIVYINEKENITTVDKPVIIERGPLVGNFNLVKIAGQKYINWTGKMTFNRKEIVSRWENLDKELEDDENLTITREMNIAFPLSIKDDEVGRIYSYLPTNIRLGFPVYINLDVHLKASRGDIKKEDFANDSLWNDRVEEEISDFLVRGFLDLIEFDSEEDLELYRDIVSLKSELYKYIPRTKNRAKSSTGTYDKSLKDFHSKIIRKNIFLDRENSWRKSEEICLFVKSQSDSVSDKEYYDYIYELLEIDEYKICKEEGVSVSKNPEWNSFLADLSKNNLDLQAEIDLVDVIVYGEGLKDYWAREDKKINRLNMLFKYWMTYRGTLQDNIKKHLTIVPLEDRDEINFYSKKEVNEKGYVLFRYGENNTKYLEKSNSAKFIYEEKFESIGELLEKILGIKSYNLVNYFDDEILKIAGDISPVKIEEFIKKTYLFFVENREVYNKSQDLDTIRTYMREWTLDLESWKHYLKQDASRELNLLYLKNLTKLDLKKIKLEESVESSYIDFLIFLGLKSGIEFIDGDLDEISKQIADEAQRDYYLDCIVKKIEKDKTSITKENLAAILEKIEFLEIKEGRYFINSKEIICSIDSDLEKIRNLIAYLRENEFEELKLEDNASYILLPYGEYGLIWDKLDINNLSNPSILASFLNSFQHSILERVEMCWIFNKVYNRGFHMESEQLLKIKDFLRLRNFDKFLQEKGENLGLILKGGYSIVPSYLSVDRKASSLYADYEDELEEFLVGINLKFSESIWTYLKIFYLVDSYKIDSYVKLEKPPCILVEKEEELSSNLIKICSIIKGDKLEPSQIKEIQSFFGEIKERRIELKEIHSKGHKKYLKEIFFTYHRRNVMLASENLKSIWEANKYIEKVLCEDFRLDDGEYMEGYGYYCPICGGYSHSALNGIVFARFKDVYGKYVYINSCLSCNKMLELANKIEILNLDLALEDFKKYYISDENHIKNNKNMKTFQVRIERYDEKILSFPMKISYLNMVLYEKLR